MLNYRPLAPQNDDGISGVKTEGAFGASPPKKQKTGGTKSGKPKAAKKVWDDGEPEP